MISCNKYLDKKSNNSLLIPSSLTDVQALLDNYSDLNRLQTPCFGEASADNYFLKPEIYNGLSLQDQSHYTWRKYFFATSSDWSSGYGAIYIANLSIDLLNDIERTSQNAVSWDQLKGAALFFRAYNFLNLLWDYAKAYDDDSADVDLGVALRLTSNFNVPSTRATNRECYHQVISDTKEAVMLLSVSPEIVTRPSKCAAYGLLARCYLSMRDYDNALLYADSALQLNSNLIDLNGDEGLIAEIDGNYPFAQFNKETIFYTEMAGYDSYYYSSKSRVDTTLYASFDDNDLRKIACFYGNPDGYYQYKGAYTNSVVCFSGIAVDEMYLIRSECFVRTGQVDKGLNDLNTLLKTKYKKNTFISFEGLSQSEALDTVLLERRKELTMRGLRWMDIKRLNKEGADIVLKRVEDDGTYILLPNANFFALQIPDDVIDETGMPQNPL